MSHDPTNVLLDDGALVVCDGTRNKCCYNKQYADLACKRLHGDKYGYSNVFATPAEGKCPPNQQSFQCRADTTTECSREYNRDGPYGTHLLDEHPPRYWDEIYKNTADFWKKSDQYCRQKYGVNAIRAFGDRTHPNGRCVRVSWDQSPQLYPDSGQEKYAITLNTGVGQFVPVTRPYTHIPTAPEPQKLEDCCDPNNAGAPGKNPVCGPQVCFGKKACDNTNIVKQVCSDRDNVAKNEKCADVCTRMNVAGNGSWCNEPIKEYCQGKNLETETCRNFCSADNLDLNPDLASFCDNQYVNYCASKESFVDKKRQEQLCGCINSPFPLASCVDANCSNKIGVMTTNLRRIFRDNLCPTICTQNIIIDGKPVVNIDRIRWTQYCPGYPYPNSPDNPYSPPKETKRAQIVQYTTIGVVLVLVILALVFLFLR